MEPVTEPVQTATAAARRAAGIIRRYLGRLGRGDVSRKEGAEFVTEVDRASERAIIETIRADFPHHAVFAEETAREQGEWRWLIDPLDGTTNFIHSYPMFSVSIALEGAGEVVCGVVLDVARGELFVAERGRGATLEGQPIRVSPTAEPADALLATGFPWRAKERLEAYLASFGRLLAQVHDMRRCGSAALDLAHVACGRLDGFWEASLKPWDVAAGALLVREAGGRVSDFGRGPDYLASGDIVASNGLLHDFIVDRLQGLRP